LPEELTTLTGRKLAQGECFALSERIRVVYSGAGPENAERSAKFLINEGANCLISWGCAAALSPQLRPGDLVVPDQVLASQQQLFNTDSGWVKHIQSLMTPRSPVTTGLLAESSRIIAFSSDKQHIHSQTGAVALDMETAGVMRAAWEARLPAIAIRAIADPVSMNLPQAVVQALNSQGKVELIKLLRYLLTHPWQVPALIKLGLHFNAARKTLKSVAGQLSELTNFKAEADR